MNVLFITRRYPPSIGGMQTFSKKLYENLKEKIQVKKISYGGRNKFLPFVLPYFLFKSVIEIIRQKPDYIILGDAMLVYLCPILNLFSKTLTVCHGLDVTYDNFLYQYYMSVFLKTSTKHIAVSKHTKTILKKKDVEAKVIHNGVDVDEFNNHEPSKVLEKFSISKKINLLTVGRLVERKGVYWFCKNVLPKLGSNYNYIVVGDGPDKDKLENLKLKNLYLLGKVSENDLKSLYKECDIFLMPNITTKGDVEGYGIVALEAGSAGLYTIVSSVDGISEAIENNKNGILVEEKDVDAYVREIRAKNKNFNSVRYNKKYRSWKKVAEEYIKLLR